MVCNNFHFPSADGKTSIHAVEWLPDGDVRAVVQIVHGVSEYIERYAPFAAFLAERGFAVVGHDHLGHGHTAPTGSTRVYFGPKGSWDWVVEDVCTMRTLAAERFPGAPFFLLGHSMGSFAARSYLIRFPGTVNGAILMGTGHMSPLLVAGGRAFAALEALRLGEQRTSAAVTALAFGGYAKVFAPYRTVFDWLNSDPAAVDAYIADPMCGENPTVGLFREMLRGIAFITNSKNIRQMESSTPILFISGAMDPVGGLSKEVRLAYEAFRKAGMQDVSLKLYPNVRHEILNESCRDTVHEDLYRWLQEKMPD